MPDPDASPILAPTPSDYLRLCKRRFGDANPERVHNPVWAWMVRKRHNTYRPRTSLGIEPNLNPPGDPDFCFDRYGAARLTLPDSRGVIIAGEHEDSYDPDFCIYNDVIVEHQGRIEIYCYPREVFPPTDFHTATLVGDGVIIIGCLGYPQERGQHTPVFRLDLTTYRIDRVPTTGEDPGWIYQHAARRIPADPPGRTRIELSGGKQTIRRDKRHLERTNYDTYHLDLAADGDGLFGRWLNVDPHRSWRQFEIRLDLDYAPFHPWRDALPRVGLAFVQPDEDDRYEYEEDDEFIDWERIDRDTSDNYEGTVRGVPVRARARYDAMHLVIMGDLPEDAVAELVDTLRAAAQEASSETVIVDEC